MKTQFPLDKTPQQNEVTKGMNIKVQKMEPCMLDELGTKHTFEREVIHIVMDIHKGSHVQVSSDKYTYELWYGKHSTIKWFRIFGRKCFIKENDDKCGKAESIVDEGILLGYSSIIKGYKCCNKRFQNIVESIDVLIDEASIGTKRE